MFTKKLRISSTLIPRSQKAASFAWRKLLVPVSIFGAVTFLLWSRFIFLGTHDYKTMEKVSRVENLINDTNKGFSLLKRSLSGTIGQKITPDYCQIKLCDTITCSSIPNNVNAETVVSSFIENDFKANCTAVESVKLLFNDCKFPENMLRRNWLRTNVSIEELTFNRCFLSEIEDSAFSSSIYEGTRKIIMVSNKLVSLRRTMFSHLEALQTLSIRENIVKSAEFDLLREVAGSLTSLELYQVINDRDVLRNITGGNALSKLEILSIQGNIIPVIDAELFVGVPAVKSLYLHDSNIKTVSPDALKPMAWSVRQLTLHNNNVDSLPEGLLDFVLSSNQPFHMFIHNNPWHCDCSLKWVQDLIRSRPNVITTIPTCMTPQSNAGKLFTTAEFCYQLTSTNSATSVTSLETTKHDWSQVNQTTTQIPVTTERSVYVVCNHSYTFLRAVNSRKLLSIDPLQFRPQFPNFYVRKILNQGVLVNLPNLYEEATLLWFDNNDVEGSLSCAKNVKGSYLLRNIDRQTSYTICLLEDNENTVSPLNCLAVTSKPSYTFGTWLTNADKTLVLPLLILSPVLLFLFGGFLSFLLIRRHPTLLRGSKRVVLVKPRNVEAIVLPKGMDIDEKKQTQANLISYGSKLQEDGYVTPLPPIPIPPPRRSRMVSRMSSQSDRHSYVSEIESMEPRLTFWRQIVLKDEMEKQRLVAPPLPPHPCDTIPSLSLAVDSKEHHDYQAFTV